MAIDVECSKCDHQWTVPTAKAGRSVYCPQCDESIVVPRPKKEVAEADNRPRVRPGHRPKTDKRSTDRAILIGSVLLLVGALVVIGLRIRSVMSDPNLEFDASPVTDLGKGKPSEAADGADQDTNEEGESVDASQSTATTSDVSATDTAAVVGGEAGTEDTTAAAMSEDERRREMLSQLTEIFVELDDFPADSRGAVSNAVETAVRGAMERCQLTCTESAEPAMQISLELKQSGSQKSLWMTADLIATDNGQPVKLWGRSGTLGAVSDQALISGILPPGLERDASAFFTSLRSEFVKARREFAP